MDNDKIQKGPVESDLPQGSLRDSDRTKREPRGRVRTSVRTKAKKISAVNAEKRSAYIPGFSKGKANTDDSE